MIDRLPTLFERCYKLKLKSVTLKIQDQFNRSIKTRILTGNINKTFRCEYHVISSSALLTCC